MAIHTAETGPHSSFLARLVGYTAVFAIFYETFGGAMRYLLVDVGALFVNNVPSVMAFALFAACLVEMFIRRRFEPFIVCVFAWGIVYLLYAAISDLDWMQSVFGFYIWALFLLGTLVCVYEQEAFVFRFLPLAWLCTVAGVILNAFVIFPWVGLSYESHGAQMEMARQWMATGGVDRLAGFSRASFSAAAITLVALAYILASRRFRPAAKCACYAVSCVALYLTTSKTEILVIVTLPLVLLVYEGLKRGVTNSWLYYNWARACQIGMAACVILLPLSLGATSLFDLPTIGFFSSDSLNDRILTTWPDGFRLLSDYGNYFIGRGMGGIGSAQLMGEPGWYTYGDNMFVYVVVTGGLFLTAPLFLAFFRSQREIFVNRPDYFEIIFLMTFCVTGIGLMANVIEDPCVAIMLGFLVARAYTSGPMN